MCNMQISLLFHKMSYIVKGDIKFLELLMTFLLNFGAKKINFVQPLHTFFPFFRFINPRQLFSNDNFKDDYYIFKLRKITFYSLFIHYFIHLR